MTATQYVMHCVRVYARARVCVYVCMLYVCVCALFFVPTDIQKSNNVKLVQSSVPPPLGPHESDAFCFCLPLLNVVVGVVNTAYALPTCFK